ncbi:thioredoxin domain-containing protein [Neobacillus cucumis]|nr:thioredoxin domain-containing protein [Neobacillus cucumis]
MGKNKKSTSNNQSSRKFFFGVVGLTIICLIALVMLSNLQKKDGTFDYNGQPYIGDKDAPVKIVEFGDYKCPICKNFNESVFPGIDKDLIKTGKAQFYFMNNPFIFTDSTRSALFAETVYHELGNESFWKFHEHLYSKQPADSKYEQIDLYSQDFLEKTLKEVVNQKDSAKVVEAFKAEKYKSDLEKDKSYVTNLNITGTPTFYVNGKQFTGNTYQDLVDTVNKEAQKKQ